MTSIEQPAYNQAIVYWEKAGLDNYGQPTISSPVELQVEWPQVRRESNAPQDSNESVGDTLVTGQKLEIGSIIWFGEWITLPSPAVDIPLYVVTENTTTPDIKGRNFRYTATIVRYGNTLPTIV